jgi:cell division protease FtsH
MFLAIWQFLSPSERRTSVAFSEFLNEVHAGRVEEVRIKDRVSTRSVFMPPTAKKPGQQKEAIGPVPDTQLFGMLKPDPGNQRRAQSEDHPSRKRDSTPFWSSTLVTLLPMLFIGVMFFLFMRQLQAGGGKAMSFGKAKARLAQ